MKVEVMYELKKIIEDYAGRYSWKDLCSFQEADLRDFVQNAQERHPNLYSLFQFYLIINDQENQDWEKEFENLQIKDLKSVIRNEILQAETPDKANQILNCFDSHLEFFHTEEEWLTFLRTLPDISDFSYYFQNLEFALEHYFENRCDLIRQISKYHDTASDALLFCGSSNQLISYTAAEFLTFVKLLCHDYEFSTTLLLCNEWHDFGMVDEVKRAEAFLLKKPLSFNSMPHLFLSEDYTQYDDIIKTSQRVIASANFELLYDYAWLGVSASSKAFLRNKLNEVLDLEDECLFKAFSILLHNGYLTKILDQRDEEDDSILSTQIDDILFKIVDAMKVEKEAVFATLLLNIPYDIWKSLSVEVDSRVLSFLSSNIPLYLDRGIISSEDLSTYERILQLSQLSLESNQKFETLLLNHSFLADEQREDVISILLTKEMEPSFDYIFNQYQDLERNFLEKQECSSSLETVPKIELARVIDLLDSGYDFEDVLCGFQKEDDVQIDTLVRSMQYKQKI